MQSIDHRRYAADQRRYLSLLRSTLDEVDTAASLREFWRRLLAEAFFGHSPQRTSVHHHSGSPRAGSTCAPSAGPVRSLCAECAALHSQNAPNLSSALA